MHYAYMQRQVQCSASPQTEAPRWQDVLFGFVKNVGNDNRTGHVQTCSAVAATKTTGHVGRNSQMSSDWPYAVRSHRFMYHFRARGRSSLW